MDLDQLWDIDILQIFIHFGCFFFFLDHSATFYNANCGTWYVENSVDTSLDLDPSNFAQLWGDFFGMRHSLAIFQYHTWFGFLRRFRVSREHLRSFEHFSEVCHL